MLATQSLLSPLSRSWGLMESTLNYQAPETVNLNHWLPTVFKNFGDNFSKMKRRVIMTRLQKTFEKIQR